MTLDAQPNAGMQSDDASGSRPALSTEARSILLGLARRSVDAAARGKPITPDFAEVAGVPEILQPRACFVTLHSEGELRGCIGQLVARQPLWEAAMTNAQRAAVSDSRFTPVRPEELASLRIEISVLTPPKPLEFGSPEDLLGKLRPGIDGVVLHLGGSMSTFLPQVWEELPDRRRFMEQLARKAGSHPTAWSDPGVAVSVYQVEHFEDP